MSHYEDLNTSKIAIVGFIGTVAVFAVILFLIVFYRSEMAAQIQEKHTDQPDWEYADLSTRQLQELNSYRWIDREKQIVQIPIKEAMEITLQALNKPPKTEPAGKEGKNGS